MLSRLLPRREPRPSPRPPAIPAGQRVYAIGDVHGCADALRVLIERIEADHLARAPAALTIVLLGDLVDRGPDAAQAIAQARALVAAGSARVLKGNHEELFVLAARGDRQAVRTLMANGGLATLRSFGITEEEAERGSFADLAALLRERVPRDVVAFLDAAEDRVAIGDYLFVHAGVRPGVPLEEQQSSDLRWIRGEFLQSRAWHGAMIVHGHTITDAPEERANRIGIDTGAFRSGVLTAIGLEGTTRWYLATTP